MTSTFSNQDMIRDAYFYEELQGDVSDLNSASLALLELLGTNFRTPLHAEFDYLAADTRAICADIAKSSSRLCARLEHHMSLFQQLRSFREAQGVWVLGLLASVFLPLSLATGLLSMQTRLVDLNLILYDFCGVIVLIATFVLIVLGLLNAYDRLHGRLLKWGSSDPGFRHQIYPFIGKAIAGSCLVIWALLLSSFLIGMVKSAELGSKILGYGIGVIGGVALLAGLCVSSLRILIKISRT